MVNIITTSKLETLKELRPEIEVAINRAYEDEFAYVTGNLKDFLDTAFLFGAERDSTVVNVKNIVFKAMPADYEDLCDVFIGEEDELLEAMQDSLKSGTPLYVEINGQPFPLRNTACLSIFQRIGIGGPALDTLPRNVLAEHMNEYAARCKGTGLLISNNRKIEALLGENYRLIPAENLMESAAEYFRTVEAAEFAGGSFSHTRADASWRTGMKTIELPTDTGFSKVLFEQTVRVSTSDCGTKAITVAPQMREVFAQNGSTQHGLNYCLPLQMDHKGSASIDNFEDQLALVGQRFEDSTEIIIKLADTNLMYPGNVLLALMKWLRIPAKYGAEVYERRKSMWGDNEKTAYEVYGSLAEVLKYVVEGEQTMKTLAEYQDRFSRGLSFNYLKHDLPGSYGYNDKLIGMKAA